MSMNTWARGIRQEKGKNSNLFYKIQTSKLKCQTKSKIPMTKCWIWHLDFGLSLSWVVGHEEKVELTGKLAEKTVVEKKLKTDLEKAQTEAEKSKNVLKETEERLALEAEERKKAEEARLLTENRLQLTEEEKKKIEEEAQSEIDELKAVVMATEEGRKRLEVEQRLKAEVEARKRAEEKWLEAETARSIAEKEARERLKIEYSLKTEAEINEEIERLRKDMTVAN